MKSLQTKHTRSGGREGRHGEIKAFINSSTQTAFIIRVMQLPTISIIPSTPYGHDCRNGQGGWRRVQQLQMLVMEDIYRKRNTMGGRMEHLQEIRNEWARLTMLTEMKGQTMQPHLHTREEHSEQMQIKKNKLDQLNSKCWWRNFKRILWSK